jgi:hypothetical protein
MINLAFKRIFVLVFYFLLAGSPLHCSVYWRSAGQDGCLHTSYTESSTCSTGALPKGNGVNMEFDPLLG